MFRLCAVLRPEREAVHHPGQDLRSQPAAPQPTAAGERLINTNSSCQIYEILQ